MPRATPKPRARPAFARHADPVGEAMRELAERGVFRQYESRALRGGRVEHRFLWLADRPFLMIQDPGRCTLSFPALLPEIEPRSELDRRVREFVRGRSDRALPEHRRIDPRRAAAGCVHRAGALGLVVRFRPPSADYAARKVIALVNEIFFSILMRERRDYLALHFDVPDE